MKKGFTLVEMLIVVVVLVTLMTITFRLSSIGEDQTRRNRTISHLQRLENCLSGYYAAFGTYPPVRLHGSRNIYETISDANGMQNVDGQENKNLWGWNEIDDPGEYAAWRQVRAACLAQPVACRFPFPDEFDSVIESVSEQIKRKANSSEARYKAFWSNPTRKASLSKGFKNLGTSSALNNLEDSDDWRETQIFQFGVMSFLLPRYTFMLAVPQDVWSKVADLKQWTNNNIPQHNPLTGGKMDWETIRKATYDGTTTENASIINIPSQAVCARWMPNLEGICKANSKAIFFGITIGGSNGAEALADETDNPWVELFTPKNGGEQYILDKITILDGWDQEFYYYSPKPYQTYTLWSGGPNKRTFPPWVDRKNIENATQANKCISKWIEDDIIHMKN